MSPEDGLRLPPGPSGVNSLAAATIDDEARLRRPWLRTPRAEVSLDPALLTSSPTPKRKRRACDPDLATDVLIALVIAVVLSVGKCVR